MAKGKDTCKILKEIRKRIAEENDIELITSECTFKGDCLGTCPKCESEVRYLERELEKRQRLGKVAVFAGISLGTLFASTGCSHVVQPLAGMPMNPTDGTEAVGTDTIPERPLAGDVLADPIKPFEPVRQEEDTLEPRLLGIVPLYQAMLPFDSEQYENTLKKLFVFHGMENLSIVSGNIIYNQTGGSDSEAIRTIEQLAEKVKQVHSPYYSDGEQKLLEYIVAELGDVYAKGKYSGDMEVKFLVSSTGNVMHVEIVKGIDKALDEAMIKVFEGMVWQPADFDMKDDSWSSSFECYCIQKIHFPIKK